MWVVDYKGFPVNLSTCRYLWVHNRSTTKGIMAHDLNASFGPEEDVCIYRGTEAECRAYVTNLVEKLNAHAKTIGDYFEEGELRSIICQMGEALNDIARQIAGINT